MFCLNIAARNRYDKLHFFSIEQTRNLRSALWSKHSTRLGGFGFPEAQFMQDCWRLEHEPNDEIKHDQRRSLESQSKQIYGTMWKTQAWRFQAWYTMPWLPFFSVPASTRQMSCTNARYFKPSHIIETCPDCCGGAYITFMCRLHVLYSICDMWCLHVCANWLASRRQPLHFFIRTENSSSLVELLSPDPCLGNSGTSLRKYLKCLRRS